MEKTVPQEDEAVSPIPDGKLWRPGHVGVCNLGYEFKPNQQTYKLIGKCVLTTLHVFR
jgi:hypothetical protein